MSSVTRPKIRLKLAKLNLPVVLWAVFVFQPDLVVFFNLFSQLIMSSVTRPKMTLLLSTLYLSVVLWVVFVLKPNLIVFFNLS